MQITDGIKNVLLAGVGAVATTAEKSTEVFQELVKKGELTVEQGKELNQELKRNLKKSSQKNDFESLVKDLTPEQLKELKDQIAKAEEQEDESES